jgi:hypothetical protein
MPRAADPWPRIAALVQQGTVRTGGGTHQQLLHLGSRRRGAAARIKSARLHSFSQFMSANADMM